jgi:rhodanese-related sulfurtransferase/rubrerythrin
MDFMATSKKIETLSVERAKEWLAGKEEGEIVVLDVRQPQEYISGHLPGAVLIPLPELLDRAGELDTTKPVLAYCRSGNRSRSAAALLLTEGFSKVCSLDGGISAWNGNVATGDYRQSMYLLKGGETAEELISLAWSLEDGSRLFYESAADMSSDNESKELFISLAEAETKHKANILRAYKTVTGKELAEDFPEKSPKGLMEGGTQVKEAIAFVNSRGRRLPDLIEVSMQVETNALDLYIKMLREIKNEDAAKVFTSLIAEEKRHLSKLGELLGSKIV